MIRGDLERQTDVLHQSVKATAAIKEKFRQARSLRENTEREFSTLFKPVIEPLQEIVEQKKKDTEQGEEERPNTGLLHQLLASFPRKDLDTTVYGVRSVGSKHMIGNGEIRFGTDQIFVDEKAYVRTPGLTELLLLKRPDENKISEDDVSRYHEIMIKTNAHRTGYNPTGAIRKNKTPKYIRYINNLVSGSGINKLPNAMLMSLNHQNKEYVFFDDPNEIITRLKLLASSYQAGNLGHTNEIMSILEELRELDIIY